jgi:hypothetical protein
MCLGRTRKLVCVIESGEEEQRSVVSENFHPKTQNNLTDVFPTTEIESSGFEPEISDIKKEACETAESLLESSSPRLQPQILDCSPVKSKNGYSIEELFIVHLKVPHSDKYPRLREQATWEKTETVVETVQSNDYSLSLGDKAQT